MARVLVMIAAATALLSAGGVAPEHAPEPGISEAEQPRLVRLWADGAAAFGVFVPSERPRGAVAADGSRLPPLYTAEGGAALAGNELLDYLFLNLEGRYDPEAITAIAAGVASADVEDPPTLLVRIPPISADGPDAANERIREALQRGADGVVMPRVRSAEEAEMLVGFFRDAGADVWSPENPEGSVIAMIMIEDPGALAAVSDIADVGGFSVLACGIGSLSRALGDRAAGEAGNQEVLAHAKRIGVPDMITANTGDVAERVDQGFLGLLTSGPQADEAIRVGREAAGR